MANLVSSNAISTLLANPSPNYSPHLRDIVVQVLDLKLSGNRYMFSASDGKMKLRAILPSNQYSEVLKGKIQNLGIIRILEYTLSDIHNKSEKYLIVTKCEPVSPALEMEIKSEQIDVVLKPKHEVIAKSAAQIVREQNGK